MSNDNETRIVHAPNLLRAKVGGGGIDNNKLRAAKEAIAGLTTEYIQRVDGDLDRMDALASELAAAADDAARSESVEAVYAIVHEMRGEAGTFGYPLASKIGNMLCRYVDALAEPHMADARVVRHHCDSLRAIVKHDITGDGGEVGQALIKDLTALVQRLSK